MKVFPRFRALLVLLVLLAAAAAGLAWAALSAALSASPAVVGPGWPALAIERPIDLARAGALLRRHDPRLLVPGQAGSIALTPTELQWLLDQAAARAGRPAAARARLGPQSLTLAASVRLPAAPLVARFGPWLDLELRFDETAAGLPTLAGARVGRLALPPWLAGWLLRQGLAQLDDDVAGLAEVVQRVRLAPAGLQLDYVWAADSTRHLVGVLLPQAEEQRMAVYAGHLRREAAAGQGGWPLAEVLAPLFRLAQTRSPDDATAVLENRAALRALAFYAAGSQLPSLPGLRSAVPLQPRPLVMRGRDDWPLHIIVSAVVAAEGGGPLADAIGVWKEVRDARSGSGFSFNDLAADRAGTRLGLLAVNAPRTLQARLAANPGDAALLPDIADLPEFLPEAVFRRRYGGIGMPAYDAVLADIERRLRALPLLN